MAIAVRPAAPKTKPEAPPAAPEQLVAILRELKSEGLPFEAAWSEGLRRVRWPKSGRETKAWREVLADTEHAWRARYEDWEPTPRELACASLYEVLRARQGHMQ